jgi:hypothetical protein
VAGPSPRFGTVLPGEECPDAKIVTEICFYAGHVGLEANGEKSHFQP